MDPRRKDRWGEYPSGRVTCAFAAASSVHACTMHVPRLATYGGNGQADGAGLGGRTFQVRPLDLTDRRHSIDDSPLTTTCREHFQLVIKLVHPLVCFCFRSFVAIWTESESCPRHCWRHATLELQLATRDLAFYLSIVNPIPVGRSHRCELR